MSIAFVMPPIYVLHMISDNLLYMVNSVSLS